MANASKSVVQPPGPVVDIGVGPMQASYSGGAPGTPSYAWSMVAPFASPTPVFLNPTNASSQIVRILSVGNNVTKTQGVRVTITDSLGNVSTQDATATADRSSGN